MNIPVLIIQILWGATWIMLCVEHIPVMLECTPAGRLAAMLIFLIGAPFFLVSNALEALLDLIFPDDWDDGDGGNNYFKY